MTNEYTNKELTVEVIDVFPEKNSVWIENDNHSGEYQIGPPADIKFAKKGQATIKFNGVGQICYIRSGAPKPAFNSGASGFKKLWNAASVPARQIQPANAYQPKESVDWDKIAYGKCKHAFLIEAFKLNMPLDKAEMLAELWTRASMRQLTEEAVIKAEIKKSKTTQEQVDDLMGSPIGEEDLGIY